MPYLIVNPVRIISFAVLCLLAALLAGCNSADERPSLKYVSTLSTSQGTLDEPFGIATRDGETFVSDGLSGEIVKIAADGTTSVFASGLDTPSAIAFGPEGELYVVDSARHSVYRVGGGEALIAGGDGESGRADGAVHDARFQAPIGIAVASDGRIFVADTYNDRICMIAGGRVTTFAGGVRGFADGIAGDARFDTPLGLSVWADKVLVADSGNRRLRVIEPDGRVWTLAGTGDASHADGVPLNASFVSPTSVTVGENGEIYIADGNAIRVIGRRSFAFVETIAGGSRGFADGFKGTARFNRPSGSAVDEKGRLLIADSDSGLVRVIGNEPVDNSPVSTRTFTSAEFRELQPPRWPFDPPTAKRDVAGTLGEIRGEIKDESSRVWFHNGLDIAGAYGETAIFLRSEKVLDPDSAANFGTLRELLRLPTIGYIHIRLGRDASDRPFNDPRFVFSQDDLGKLSGVRVPRGASFAAGDRVGTLNAMNHVHLIAGPSGGEMNALEALTLPGVSDSISPEIEDVTFYDADWREIETRTNGSRIKISGPTRIVVRAFDRMDGNPDRRRLGVYRVGYELLQNAQPIGSGSEIRFDVNPPADAVRFVYATGSRSGATGETIFNYIATNRLSGKGFSEEFLDTRSLATGVYAVRVYAADLFGNITTRTIEIEVTAQ